MADWKSRAQIDGDVVSFRYAPAEIEKGYSEVFVWDLDKTYLDTSWGSLRELWRTALEKAFQKRNVPGTGSLVRALKDSWTQSNGQRRPFPLFFITASPPQMETKIREKLELDEIMPLGFFCKDNLRNLRPSRLWRLTQQVGFKIQALLLLRSRLGPDTRQALWGDDSESDATIYSLYSDICARRWPEKELLRILRGLGVVGEQTEAILALQDVIPPHDPVEKIYINLASDTDPEYYVKFGRRMVPTYDTFQAALDLFQDGRLQAEQAIRVASDMTMNYGFTPEELEASIDNLVRRRLFGAESCEAILPLLRAHRLISVDFAPSAEPVSGLSKAAHEAIPDLEPWVPEQIDYLHEFR
jgi:hypothetical protein